MWRSSNVQHPNWCIHLWKQVFEGLITYSKVRRINCGYVTHYTVFMYSMYVCMVITYSRVCINRLRLPILLVVSWTGKMNIPLSPYAPENLVSRDGFSRPVPRQPARLHTQAESGAYLRDSSRVPRPFIYFKPPYAMGSVPSLSGHEIAYRWRLLPRVRRHRASKPQGSSEGVLPWQVTMDQLICASLSHTHHWYEVGKLKVPASYYKTSVRDQDYSNMIIVLR